MDKDITKKIDEALQVGTRIADALDTLVNEPLVELRVAPPQCPYCGEINPTVKIMPHPDEVQGPMSDFLVEVMCTHCGKLSYSISAEWKMVPDQQSALQLGKAVSERMKQNND